MLSPDWDSIGCIIGVVMLHGLIAMSGLIGETYGAIYGIAIFIAIILIVIGLYKLDCWLLTRKSITPPES